MLFLRYIDHPEHQRLVAPKAGFHPAVDDHVGVGVGLDIAVHQLSAAAAEGCVDGTAHRRQPVDALGPRLHVAEAKALGKQQDIPRTDDLGPACHLDAVGLVHLGQGVEVIDRNDAAGKAVEHRADRVAITLALGTATGHDIDIAKRGHLGTTAHGDPVVRSHHHLGAAHPDGGRAIGIHQQGRRQVAAATGRHQQFALADQLGVALDLDAGGQIGGQDVHRDTGAGGQAAGGQVDLLLEHHLVLRRQAKITVTGVQVGIFADHHSGIQIETGNAGGAGTGHRTTGHPADIAIVGACQTLLVQPGIAEYVDRRSLDQRLVTDLGQGIGGNPVARLGTASGEHAPGDTHDAGVDVEALIGVHGQQAAVAGSLHQQQFGGADQRLGGGMLGDVGGGAGAGGHTATASQGVEGRFQLPVRTDAGVSGEDAIAAANARTTDGALIDGNLGGTRRHQAADDTAGLAREARDQVAGDVQPPGDGNIGALAQATAAVLQGGVGDLCHHLGAVLERHQGRIDAQQRSPGGTQGLTAQAVAIRQGIQGRGNVHGPGGDADIMGRAGVRRADPRQHLGLELAFDHRDADADARRHRDPQGLDLYRRRQAGVDAQGVRQRDPRAVTDPRLHLLGQGHQGHVGAAAGHPGGHRHHLQRDPIDTRGRDVQRTDALVLAHPGMLADPGPCRTADLDGAHRHACGHQADGPTCSPQ